MLPEDISDIAQIKMFVKLRCDLNSPEGDCGDWDVFANVRIKDPLTQQWFELGRYITPYNVDNSQRGTRGFEFDVTDFKSLLTGEVELEIYIETWTKDDGWLVSVDFDYIHGTPDYPYYAITPLINKAGGTFEIEYGKGNDYTPLLHVEIPKNSEEIKLRTIISGWGHSLPYGSEGTACAEWCYQTHYIQINGQNTFKHYLDTLGCSQNPVQPQNGTWQYERAGWCPGMEVPVREDVLPQEFAGNSFTFNYAFEPYIATGQIEGYQPGAYYAISSFVVVKSNTPVERPEVSKQEEKRELNH